MKETSILRTYTFVDRYSFSLVFIRYATERIAVHSCCLKQAGRSSRTWVLCPWPACGGLQGPPWPSSLRYFQREETAARISPSSHRLCFSIWGMFTETFFWVIRRDCSKSREIFFTHTSAKYLGSFLFCFVLCSFAWFLFCQSLTRWPLWF